MGGVDLPSFRLAVASPDIREGVKEKAGQAEGLKNSEICQGTAKPTSSQCRVSRVNERRKVSPASPTPVSHSPCLPRR